MNRMGKDRLQDQTLALRSEAAELRSQIAQILAQSKRHTEELRRGADEAREQTLRTFAQDLTVVADRLSRVLKDAPDPLAEGLSSLLMGLQLTERELSNVSERHGLCRLAPEPGQTFNPAEHLAILGSAHSGARIVGVVTPGYSFQGDVLRQAAVVLEDVHQDSDAAVRWLQELAVPGERSGRGSPAVQFVQVAGPQPERPFDRQAITALLSTLRAARPSGTVAQSSGGSALGVVPERQRPAFASRLAVAAGVTTLVITGAMTVVLLSPTGGSDPAPGRDVATVTAPRALTVRVAPEVRSPPAQQLAGAQTTRRIDRPPRAPAQATQLVERSATPASPFEPSLNEPLEAEMPVLAATAPEVAASPSPARAQAGPIVLAERRQSQGELGSLLANPRRKGSLANVSLERDTQQRLSATLSPRP